MHYLITAHLEINANLAEKAGLLDKPRVKHDNILDASDFEQTDPLEEPLADNDETSAAIVNYDVFASGQMQEVIQQDNYVLVEESTLLKYQEQSFEIQALEDEKAIYEKKLEDLSKEKEDFAEGRAAFDQEKKDFAEGKAELEKEVEDLSKEKEDFAEGRAAFDQEKKDFAEGKAGLEKKDFEQEKKQECLIKVEEQGKQKRKQKTEEADKPYMTRKRYREALNN
jgi:hypothetical protein